MINAHASLVPRGRSCLIDAWLVVGPIGGHLFASLDSICTCLFLSHTTSGHLDLASAGGGGGGGNGGKCFGRDKVRILSSIETD